MIVRTSLIYGGPQPSRHEQTALDVADGGASLAFYTDELRCPVAVSDLAAALLPLVDSTFPGSCTSPVPTRCPGRSSPAW